MKRIYEHKQNQESGSHKVVGTCIIRTSDSLTATQQKELEAAIIEALTKLD